MKKKTRDNAEKNGWVELLVISCEEATTKTVGKQEQIHSFADKTKDPKTMKSDFESWRRGVIVQDDEILKKGREYIDSLPQTENLS